MSASLKPIPGTADIWPPEIQEWLEIENAARTVFPLYGYEELRTPMMERTELFVHGIGDQTEVVQKEMYTFEDRGGRSLTLRPEGTAGVMRAIARLGLAPDEEHRIFYLGPMFRGERPAAGRRRQFHQVGVEAVGRATPAADAECILMLLHYLERIGIRDARVLVNTRGTAEDRRRAAAGYQNYFRGHIGAMCEDCGRRVKTNIWRILDCKDPRCQPVIDAAPEMLDLVSDESRTFFLDVLKYLDMNGAAYTVSPRLVRGLDYYEHTVFEIVHDGLGAQNAIAGGGRYRLFLPGRKTPVEGVGFAAGIERLILVRQALGVQAGAPTGIDSYVVCLGTAALDTGLRLALELRRRNLRTLCDLGGDRSMKAQLRRANKAGARHALILGERELEAGTVTCKDLKTGEQEEVPLTNVPNRLAPETETGSRC